MTELAAWIVYALEVGALFALGAWSAEHALRSLGRSARWVWVLSMLLTVALPLWAWLRPESWDSAAALPAAGFLRLAPIMVGSEAVAGARFDLDALMTMAWAVLTGVLVFRLLLAYVQLEESRRSWRPRLFWGERVWVTRDLGPAVVGLRRTSILMPEWALYLERRIQQLMLKHECEHVRAGDVRLAAFGQLLLLAFPWNLSLWFQLRRLREAVEVDCDRRVLAQDPDARAYGALLLEVGRRRSMPQLALAFAEPRTFLERRIQLLTTARRHAGRAAMLAAVALVAVAVAVCTRDPLAEVLEPKPVEAVTEQRKVSPYEMVGGPVFTPFTVPPRLQNREHVTRALEQNYPPLLRDAGIAGQVLMWFLIDETGTTRTTQVYESSGYPALDMAAERVAKSMQFSPAMNRDEHVAVWVQIPIKFSSGPIESVSLRRSARSARSAQQSQEAMRGTLERERETREAMIENRLRELSAQVQQTIHPVVATSSTRQDLSSTLERISRDNLSHIQRPIQRPDPNEPSFTPFTTAPSLANSGEVARALERNYPKLLRDAGVGGQSVMWFHIDETGRVTRASVYKSSSFPAFDDAALRVADVMRFSPAKNGEQAVPVWVQIPIRFSTR